MWKPRRPLPVLILMASASLGVLLRSTATAQDNRQAAASNESSCALPKDSGVALRCVSFGGHVYAVADIDLRSYKVLFTTSAARKMQSYPEVAADLRASGWKPILVTNAGIYGTDNRPRGLLISPKGKEHDVARVESRNGNFSWHSAVFQIRDDNSASILPARDWQNDTHTVAATQSGPQLVADNAITSALAPTSTSTYLRTAVGVDRSSRGLIHIAVSRDAVTLFELASFMVEGTHSREALHLDGSLSAFYLPAAADPFVFSDPGECIVTALSVVKK